ncbi:MAG TPA: lysophospholipid acyltransferase family protein [Desulfosalsimonadaceae bacterium]|nr:lysophospholipid acyltransferase family protein [Desulfosalsimonadaceae bacterium]
MNRKSRFSLFVQYATGRVAVFVTGPLVMGALRLAGYRLRDLRQVRRQVAQIMARHEGPWLICANHLTLIDSFILAHAMFPLHRYLLRYRLVPWNVPEHRNFNRNPIVAFFCYLLKCVPVKRGGERSEIKHTMEKCAHLLQKGENLMIFPEGTRSRTGRVNTEDFTYHVGRLYCKTPGCRVLCLYLRGDRQESYSSVPAFGEKFCISVSECQPHTQQKGLRAQRECAAQIVGCLAEMEEDWFALRRK